jgi:hypothetical protein
MVVQSGGWLLNLKMVHRQRKQRLKFVPEAIDTSQICLAQAPGHLFCKNRQTTLQSSTFEEGCLFHAVEAAATTILAAACSLSASQTMDAT